MASTTSTASSYIEMSYELRLALSQFLLALYETVDHTTLAAAQAKSSLIPSGMDSQDDTEMSDVSATSLETGEIISSDSSSSKTYPERLTMHYVLAEALQYLQLTIYGTIISAGAHQYSHQELVVNLQRFLEEDAITTTFESVGHLRRGLTKVLAELKTGNTPVEPIARLHHGFYIQSFVSNPESSYRSTVSQQQVSPLPFFVDSIPTYQVPIPSSSLSSYRSSDSSNVTGDEVTQYIQSTTCRPGDCSIVPTDSVSSVGYHLPSSRLRAGSISPLLSNCSIAPSESASNAAWALYAPKNEFTWKAHPYRTDGRPTEVVGEANYDIDDVREVAKQMRYFGDGSVDPSQGGFDSDSSYQSSEYSSLRSEGLSARSPESSALILTVDSQCGEGVPVAPAGPKSLRGYGNGMVVAPTEPKALRELGHGIPNAPTMPGADRSSRGVPIVRTAPRADRSPPRLAMGMGSASVTASEELSEGERITRALDKIDKWCDEYFAESKKQE